MSILGNPVVRREDRRMVTDGGTYVDDVAMGGTAHVAFVRSTVAHGRITGVDIAEARQAPGVLGVFVGADLAPIGHLPHIIPGYPPETRRPFLATEVVRFVGEPVAAVVAEDRYLATDAAELVVVDYEPLPAVTGPAAAARDEVLLFPELGTNALLRIESPNRADFSGCEVVVELTLEDQRMNAAPIEPRAALVHWTDEGRLVMYSSCQGAHPTRDALCAVYGLEPSQARVVVPDMGGGFGAKSRTAAEAIALGHLSRQVGRPLRWTETRSENMVAMPHGRAQLQHVRIGGTRDGRVTAYQLDVVQDAGAYPLIGAFLPNMTQRMLTGVYDWQNVGFSAVSVATNAISITAFRGAGRPEAALATERAIDAFAAEVGLDPADVRRKNLVGRFTEPYTTGIGTVYDVGDYPEALERVLQAAGYEALRASQAAGREAGGPVLLGIGLSVYVEITGGGPSSEFGSVQLGPDGRVSVVTGATPYGQGHETMFAMIVADRTGIAMDRVDVVAGDTDRVPAGGMTTGSRSMQIAGAAVADAAAQLTDAARRRAADLLEAAAEDVVLDWETGRFHVAGTPAVALDWPQVAAAAAAGEVGAGDAAGATADEWTFVSGFKAAQPTYPFGAHLAVVEVDEETGRARLVRLVAVDDAGTILNPLLAEGQVHGGMAQGAAQALLEEIRFDEDGNPLTTNFADYPVISAAELPMFELVHMETPTWVNELGAKGVGESGTVGAIPAVQNAVIDALAPYGVRHLDMPLTPERVWQAIHGSGVGGDGGGAL
ncbi:MAG: molybdopterin-dependent oxidoreductase [Acidimicrobiia bacterium]|nr:molybdopterin-dependent oxidoreductase [Acidimicrobiia bacterium]